MLRHHDAINAYIVSSISKYIEKLYNDKTIENEYKNSNALNQNILKLSTKLKLLSFINSTANISFEEIKKMGFNQQILDKEENKEKEYQNELKEKLDLLDKDKPNINKSFFLQGLKADNLHRIYSSIISRPKILKNMITDESRSLITLILKNVNSQDSEIKDINNLKYIDLFFTQFSLAVSNISLSDYFIDFSEFNNQQNNKNESMLHFFMKHNKTIFCLTFAIIFGFIFGLVIESQLHIFGLYIRKQKMINKKIKSIQ